MKVKYKTFKKGLFGVSNPQESICNFIEKMKLTKSDILGISESQADFSNFKITIYYKESRLERK